MVPDFMTRFMPFPNPRKHFAIFEIFPDDEYGVLETILDREIEKPVSDQVLLDHIQNAIAQDVRKHKSRAENHVINGRLELLTRRERQVMEMVVAGMSSKQIALELKISFKTIEAHRARIMKKMAADSVPHLIHMSLSLCAGEQK